MNKIEKEELKKKKEQIKYESKKAIKEANKTHKKFWDDFKQFALKGNVMDLAVGVLIGAAFQSVVTSFTNNIISPVLGCLNEVNLSEFSLKIGNLDLKYGAFLTDVINFLIMALVVFVVIKLMNKLADIGKKKSDEEKVSTMKKCPYCYSEIDIKAIRCPYCTSELEEKKI